MCARMPFVSPAAHFQLISPGTAQSLPSEPRWQHRAPAAPGTAPMPGQRGISLCITCNVSIPGAAQCSRPRLPPGTAKQSCAALTEHPALRPARAADAKACKTLKAWKTGGKSRKHQFFRLCCSVWLHASLRKGDPPCPGNRTQKGATAALSGGEQGSALCWSLDPAEKFSFPKS